MAAALTNQQPPATMEVEEGGKLGSKKRRGHESGDERNKKVRETDEKTAELATNTFDDSRLFTLSDAELTQLIQRLSVSEKIKLFNRLTKAPISFLPDDLRDAFG